MVWILLLLLLLWLLLWLMLAMSLTLRLALRLFWHFYFRSCVILCLWLITMEIGNAMVMDGICEHRFVLWVQLCSMQVSQHLPVSLWEIISWRLVFVVRKITGTHSFLTVNIDVICIQLASQKLLLLIFVVNLYLRKFLYQISNEFEKKDVLLLVAIIGEFWRGERGTANTYPRHDIDLNTMFPWCLWCVWRS